MPMGRLAGVLVAGMMASAVACGAEAPNEPYTPPAMSPDPEESGCKEDQKLCDDECVRKGVLHGCDAESCEPCPKPANAYAGCADGACSLSECEMGYDDCDGDESNGCEAKLANDAQNCGACGAVCEGADNASVGCLGGACVLTACQDGWFDNDDFYENGCEGDAFNPVNPITRLSPDADVCPAQVPKAAAECNFQLFAKCFYSHPALTCSCVVQCYTGFNIGEHAAWKVECERCGSPSTETWELGFNSATLGDLGTVTAPTDDSYVFYNGDCETLSINTDTLVATCGNQYIVSEARQQTNGSEVAVFYFNHLTFTENAKLEVSGSRPLALVAKTIEIQATLSLFSWQRGATPPPGSGQDALTSPVNASGGGGGHCTAGGKGGGGALGGVALGDETSPLLTLGAPGGKSRRRIMLDGPNGMPDYQDAGGAIQLIAADSITLGEKASISVNGGTGASETSYGSNGGGSGGSIIIEAPNVTIDGYLSAIGGDGGSPVSKHVPGSIGAPVGDAPDPEEGGGGAAGIILIYGDNLKIFEPRVTPAPATACTEFRPLLR